MPNKIARVEIEPGDDGSHGISTSFRSTPQKRGGVNGGIFMDSPEREIKHFGPQDGQQVLTHLAKTLKIPFHKSAK